MVRLSRSDLESILDFAKDAAACAKEAQRQDAWLLGRIARLIGSDMIKYCRVDASEREHDVTVLGEAQAWPSASGEVLEALRTEVGPFTAFGARTGQPFLFATRLFDIIDRGAFRRTKLYQFIPFAEASSVQMRMPAHDGSLWIFEALQPDREFSDRQLSLLDAARPWLELYEERRVIAARVAAVSAAPADVAAASRLSPREQQVLDRVADGRSNQEIADALGISPGTVRKHLENIYAKLDVTNRTAALARTGRASAVVAATGGPSARLGE